ncbi:MAG: endospore germination permease [Bacillota bacterium]|nr:endospore germination permease [Bacillota bacterium]
MLEDGRISAWQATGLLISTVLATAVLFVPAVTAAAAGRDAWLALLPAALLGGGIGWLAARLALRFPGETVIRFAPRLLGRIPGKVVGFLFVFYFFWAGYVILAEFHVLLGAAYLPRTPAVVHMGVLVLLAAFMVSRGLEIYARVNDLILPVLLLAALLVFLFTAKDIQVTYFQPLLENGPLPVLRAALTPGGWLAETAVILMLLPYITCTEQRRAARAVLLAAAVLTVVLVLVLVATLGNFGAGPTADVLFPTFMLIRQVHFETLPVFERQDPVFMLIWIAGMLVKVGAFFYAGLLALGQWLGLADYRPLVLPLGVLLVALAVQGFPNVVYLVRYVTETVPAFLLLVNGGLTAVLWLAAALRRGKRPS